MCTSSTPCARPPPCTYRWSAASLSLLALHMSVAATAAIAARDGAFHGYSEKSAPKPNPPQSASCRDHNSACTDWAAKGECDKNPKFMQETCPAACHICQPAKVEPDAYKSYLLVLKTAQGDIRIKPAWETAPKAAALVMDLAAQADDQKAACRFYRNEAVPLDPQGPPYGLFQGSLAGMLSVPGQEGSVPPTRGAAAMITGTTEFYISLMDHTSWGTAHTVWGFVEDMKVVDSIVNNAPYKNFTHPQYGTVMRMMLTELKFTPVLELIQMTEHVAEL